MNAAQHLDCYGSMFPTGNRRQHPGKVFSLQIVGPAGVLPPACKVVTDRNAWIECLQCADFDSCYKLSMATLLLETAVGT